MASGVEDLKAAMAVVTKETGQSKAHFYGTSSGGIRAAAYAQAQPERVGRLMLAAFTYKGNGAAEIERRRKRIEKLRASNRRKRDGAMITSIFTRDGHPELYDKAMIEALIADEMKFGDEVPSGTYIDMAANLPIVDPRKILSPVLMLRGEFDGNSTNDDLLDFYRQLPTGDRAFVIRPQTAPEHVGRLALCAFTYKGNGAAEIERRRKKIEQLRASPRRKRDSAMIRSIFTRDGHPELYDPAMVEALIADEMKFGNEIPSGTYLDMAANLPIVDPKKISSPVLMLRGEFDGNSTNDDLLDFYRQLPNGDRQFVILPQTAHSSGYSRNRHLLFYAVHNFFAAPAPVGA